MKSIPVSRSILSLSAILMAGSIFAQNNQFEGVTIETVPVSGAVSMLTGSGGNIGVSSGDDGVLIIDDQYAPLAPRIRAALEQLGSDTPKFLLNTHFHGDHTGGNEVFGESSIIVAHKNVRGRLLGGSAPSQALPVVTFDDNVSLHFNGEDITLIHMPAGHTDTDSVVMFSESDVIHMGDHFFNGGFPFVDLANGGTVQGYLRNLEKALSWIDDDTAVIPGHGPLATKADLLAFYNMIKDTSTQIRVSKSRGMSKEAIVAEGLGPELASWGTGFINEQRWIETVYDSYPR